jgi:hypothetical protein
MPFLGFTADFLRVGLRAAAILRPRQYQPHAIYAGANADDPDGRADQLEKVSGALQAG